MDANTSMMVDPEVQGGVHHLESCAVYTEIAMAFRRFDLLRPLTCAPAACGLIVGSLTAAPQEPATRQQPSPFPGRIDRAGMNFSKLLIVLRLLEGDARWLYEWGEGWTLDPRGRQALTQGAPVPFSVALDSAMSLPGDRPNGSPQCKESQNPGR